MNEYRTILVPFDFSAHATEAFEHALDVAKRYDGNVHLLNVMPASLLATTNADALPLDLSDVRDSLFESLCDVAAAAEKRASCSVVARVVTGMNIADTIREAASEISADLIVMGTQGRTGLAHLLLGSVTERTLRGAPCPVLTVRSPIEADSAIDPEPESSSGCLETMTEAIGRLERAGYRESFQARGGMLYGLKGERSYAPEELVVQEIVRFEGESDPGDSTMLFALRSRDESILGTFVTGYGTSADAESAAVVAKLEANQPRENCAPRETGRYELASREEASK